MNEELSLKQQVEKNWQRVVAAPQFDAEKLWLTFYLWGHPGDLQCVANGLAGDGWVNTGGSEGGFLYPKVPVQNAAADVVSTALRAEQLCAGHQVGIILIDADISPEIGGERPIVTLYKNPE